MLAGYIFTQHIFHFLAANFQEIVYALASFIHLPFQLAVQGLLSFSLLGIRGQQSFLIVKVVCSLQKYVILANALNIININHKVFVQRCQQPSVNGPSY